MHDEGRFIWELSPVGLAKVERSGTFVAVNPRFCEITGYSEHELVKKSFQDITHPDDLVADVAEAAHLADGTGDSYQMVKRYISKDGRVVWVSLYVHAIRETNGTFLLFLVFAIELLHVNLGHSGPTVTGAASRAEKRNSFLAYVRENPKEALLIGGAVFALAQGKNIFDILIGLLFPK